MWALNQIIQLLRCKSETDPVTNDNKFNFIAANEQIKQMRIGKRLHLESFKIENGTLQLDRFRINLSMMHKFFSPMAIRKA